MAQDQDETSPLDALSDAEYDQRVSETIGAMMDRFEDELAHDDPLEAELRFAAAPTALRNILAHLIAEHCVDQPRPVRTVKDMVKELDIERMALAMLKDLQAGAGAEAGEG